MNHTLQLPADLVMDLRERMVRIETKLDVQAEKSASLASLVDDHAAKLAALETEAAQVRSSVRTLKWVGGAIVTGLTLFGDSVVKAVT